MQKILVPIDGSKPARKALKYAIWLIQNGLIAEIVLLNVQPFVLPAGDLPLLDIDLIEEAQRNSAAKILKSASGVLTKSDIPHTQHTEVGDIAPAIVQYANQQHCGAIVMGSRGMGAMGNLLLGSTSSQVIHLATMPVTLVK